MPSVIGQTVSHYRVISHLGAGGMGTVWLAEDTKLHRRVALKFLPTGTAADDESAERLLREARAASVLDHPHIGTIYEVGEFEGQPFIAMAYYDGETLAKRLERGPLPIAETARILAQVADALSAAHAAGIVHRDLKPSNLMLTASGQVKVLDFGIATVASSDAETMPRLTGVGSTVGTAAYMSPEQAAGEEVDWRSDLWSLGVVAREMLTARPVFEGNNVLAVMHAVLTTTPEAIRVFRPDVAGELEEITTRTMARDRSARTITAAEVRDRAASCHARLSGVAPAVRPAATSRRVWLAAGVIVLVALGGAIAWWAQRNAKVRWAREKALPEIIRLAGIDSFDEAFRLAQEARQYIPDDPLLAEQMRTVARAATIESEPSGAAVFYRPYGRADEAWRPLGITPVKGASVPRGLHHWKVEKTGFEVAEDVGTGPFWPPVFHFKLVPAGRAPAGMVRVVSSGEPFQLYIPGLDHLPRVNLPDYWIDRREVTNRDYERFVADGGYRRPDLWREPFVKDGRPIAFDAAMALLVDTTGRPGPASWEQGAYPPGEDDLPVTGVSWYEAAAYARWAGKSLPTIYHWSRAADQRLSGNVVPASNFSGKRLLPAGSLGLTRAGTTDMAGNVKEWCWNSSGPKRYILGGAWNEPVYMFTDPDAQSPFARNPTYGFRCIKADRPEDLHAGLTGDAPAPSRDLRNVPPVSDAVFRAWQSMYSFDHGHLNATVDAVDDSPPEWRVEKVSYGAAYGDERIPAYLFLPKQTKPPYQVIVYFPGSGVIAQRSDPNAAYFDRVNFIMRSGRAMLYPIFKSTHSRGDVITNDYPSTTAVWRDHMVMWSKDVGRSIDYLQSRPDIDKNKIGYMGYSWGAALAPLFLAVEPRLSLALLNVGGFYLQAALPEADPVHFAPRVKVPVLMLNGRFDFFFPTETSQEPMFDALGTPPEHKRRVLYDASHAVPRNEMIKEFAGWMDKYWGEPVPVNGQR
jgi:formylglycine-generating enzyme required for sulfatase activity/dienelactone hydrolase/predicted Ser/Thr protein kinase